jgi:hypothetical protein
MSVGKLSSFFVAICWSATKSALRQVSSNAQDIKIDQDSTLQLKSGKLVSSTSRHAQDLHEVLALRIDV